jgi:glycosyltransferase involved in cell wall biosynthesis
VRLLLISSDPLDVEHGSGTAMAIARLRSALAGSDVDVPVLTPARRGRSATLTRWRFNRRVAVRQRYDAVLGVGGDGWRVAERLNLPYVALAKAMYARAARSERGATVIALRMHAAWEKAGLRRADCVIAPSHDTAEALVHDYGCDAKRIRVIPEPFDLQAWRQALPQRERRGDRVLCVAHLYPRKRVRDLIRAWPRVQRARPDARLDVVGDGPELHAIARRARGLRGVYLHGHVDHPEVLEFFARASSFVLPSVQETFGYAVVEALASGLPAVVAAAGALPEIVAGAVHESFPAGDIDLLAAAVLRSLDRDVRERAAELNPRRAETFDSATVAQGIVEIVEELRRTR